MKERTVVHWLVKRLHLKLSGVVCLVTTGWLGVHECLLKRALLPRLSSSRLTAWTVLPLELFSLQAVVTGYIISIAASDLLASRTVSLLGKRRDGTIGAVRYAAFLPYHVGLTTKLRLERSSAKLETTTISSGHMAEPPYNKIAERLYLGGWPADDRLLPPAGEGKLGKLAVCDVTAELPKRVKSVDEDAYLVVPVWDSHAPSTAEMNAAVRWSVGKLEAGYVLYVHCAHGHGRSAVIAGGILRALGRASDVGAAVDLMRAARPLVKLNSRQLAALKDWDEKFN